MHWPWRTSDQRSRTTAGRKSARLTLLALPLALGLGATAAPASAQDLEYGEYLSNQCMTCHQRSGRDTGIPSIVGWDTDSFVAVIVAYKRKERANKVMQNIAATLGEDEIAALAAYFATIKPTPNPGGRVSDEQPR